MKRGREEFDDIKKFFDACGKDKDMVQVQEFIERGVDVNDARGGGIFEYTALHVAAMYENDDVAKVLIENGADVNAVDKNKRNPLHCPLLYGHADVVKVLIQNGADVNAVDKDKRTVLHHAARKGHVDVAEMLIQNGADVNAVEKIYKRTALHFALENEHAVLALQLVCFGADIGKTSNKLLRQVKERLNLLRSGRRIGTSLMSNEERYWMWNLAFLLTIQNPGASFKVYYTIRSFITFHGIFMAKGYELGNNNVWKGIIKRQRK